MVGLTTQTTAQRAVPGPAHRTCLSDLTTQQLSFDEMRVVADPTQSADCSDAEFLRWLAGYRHSGGLMRCVEMQRCDPAATAAHRAASVCWGGLRWYPSFQFLRQPWQLCPNAAIVVAQLRPVLDERELLDWFITPNCWLNDRRPVDVIAHRPQWVAEAARTDRFVVGG